MNPDKTFITRRNISQKIGIISQPIMTQTYTQMSQLNNVPRPIPTNESFGNQLDQPLTINIVRNSGQFQNSTNRRIKSQSKFSVTKGRSLGSDLMEMQFKELLRRKYEDEMKEINNQSEGDNVQAGKD